MCGIVAGVGSNNVVPVLVQGLQRLEYRGYDSCGVAVWNDGLKRARSTARVAELLQRTNAAYFAEPEIQFPLAARERDGRRASSRAVLHSPIGDPSNRISVSVAQDAPHRHPARNRPAVSLDIMIPSHR